MANIDYIGDELELFKHAVNWKDYYGKEIKPYISGEVCEVGAGIGGTTNALLNRSVSSWLAVEPDGNLAEHIGAEVLGNPFASKVDVLHGTLDDIGEERQFDTIIYIDVMEHIEGDQAEFDKAVGRLRKGGNLIILVPAFNFLYNDFDRRIGHFRRYNKGMLKRLAEGRPLTRLKLSYYDSLGFFASVMNKLILKKPIPSAGNIKMWDNFMIPLSKLIDPLILRSFGKSLIAVWQKE